MMKRRRLLPWLASALVLASLALGGCEPTPGYLERWANTEGSEEMFTGYLQDPELSHEVHVKALELLIDQWEYSSGLFTSGELLGGMPDPAERDATIMDVVPHLQARYDNPETRGHTMDALYHIRRSTDSNEVHQAIDGILVGWVTNAWEPCLERGGMVSTPQLFTVLGAGPVKPRILHFINEGRFEDVICLVRGRMADVDWLAQQEDIAMAYTERWDAEHQYNVELAAQIVAARSGEEVEGSGEEAFDPDHAESRYNGRMPLLFELLEHTFQFRDLDAYRNWLFESVAQEGLDPLFKNAMLDLLNRNPRDDDGPRYVELLQAPRLTRWAAFQTLVDRQSSEGLTMALDNLPNDASLHYIGGGFPDDGFKTIAEDVLCSIGSIEELGDNARRVFEERINAENPYVRSLSITCLQRYGDAQTIETLRAALEALGRDEVPVPGFGEGVTFQSLIEESITAIETRLAAPDEGDEGEDGE